MTNKQLAKKLREAAVLKPYKLGGGCYLSCWGIGVTDFSGASTALYSDWLFWKRHATNTERGMFLLFCACYLESES